MEFGYKIGVCYKFDVNLLHKHQIGLTKNDSKIGVCYKFDGYKIEVMVYRLSKHTVDFFISDMVLISFVVNGSNIDYVIQKGWKIDA